MTSYRRRLLRVVVVVGAGVVLAAAALLATGGPHSRSRLQGTYDITTTIPLTGGAFGDSEEFDRYVAVETRIITALDRSGAGVHDGNSVGDGTFELFDLADEIEPALDVLLPVLRSSRLPAGTTVRVTRSDDRSDTVIREVRL